MQGSFHQVQVNIVNKGLIKHEFILFGGKLKDLQFDFNMWTWNQNS
jgi:hypothetical protein